MAKCWLLKTEPREYSFDDLVREGRTVWDGVTNPLALRHLRAIQPRDELLIYHSGSFRAVVGVARAASRPYPDPSRSDPRLVVVDVAPVQALPRPIPLAAVKADPRFRAFDLVRLPRLSVMPVPPPLWRALLGMARTKEPRVRGRRSGRAKGGSAGYAVTRRSEAASPAGRQPATRTGR
jgi:predicted RNA-binding protein with PUA-like domain